MYRILVADDIKDVADSLVRELEKAGYDATAAYSDGEVIELFEIALKVGEGFDAVIVDMRMDKHNSGLEILQEVKKLDSSVEVIILTGYGEPGDVITAIDLVAFDYIEKGKEELNGRNTYDLVVVKIRHALISKKILTSFKSNSDEECAKFCRRYGLDYEELKGESRRRKVADMIKRLSKKSVLDLLEKDDIEGRIMTLRGLFLCDNPEKIQTSVLVVDIVGFTSKNLDTQVELFKILHSHALEVSNELLGEDDNTQAFSILTGDGMAIVFPEPHGKCAVDFGLKLLDKKKGRKLKSGLRLGLHYGPAFLLTDTHTGQNQLIGNVINIATRVEAAAEEDMLLVSREYYMSFIEGQRPDLKSGEERKLEAKHGYVFYARPVISDQTGRDWSK